MSMREEFAEKLKMLRKHYNITQDMLAKELGIGKSAISNYENGVSMPDSKKLIKIANRFNVSVDMLLGRVTKFSDSGVVDYQTVARIPILDRIRVALPLYPASVAIGYMEFPGDLPGNCDDYFGFVVKGDSMDRLHMFDGDTVLVRKQSIISNGDIAVVVIDEGEALIKRYYKSQNTVTLMPESNNPAHQPQIYDTTQTKVAVLGKVVKAVINF